MPRTARQRSDRITLDLVRLNGIAFEAMQAIWQTVRRIRDAGRGVGCLVNGHDMRAW